MKRVDGHNVLILFVKILCNFLLCIVLSVPSITSVFGVLFESVKKNGLMVVHHLAKEHRSEEFRMIGEHNFLLDTSCTQSPTSDVLVGEVDFNMSSEVLDGLGVRFELVGRHRRVSVFLEDFLYFLCQVLALDGEFLLCLLVGLLFAIVLDKVMPKVLDYSFGFVLLV